MIKEAQSLVGSKVLHFDSGEPLAILNLPIINPDTGIIEAFWVKPFRFGTGNAIIQVGNIVEFKKNIYIKSENVIADPADIIRLSNMLAEERWFINASVRNEDGKQYGKVIDLSFDTKTYMLRQIYVEKAVLGLIPTDRRIFAWDRILKVLPDGIVIDDSTEEKEAVISDVAEPAAG